jgi:Sortase domain
VRERDAGDPGSTARKRRKAVPWILAGASAALVGGGVLIATAHRTPAASSLDHQVAWPGSQAQPVRGRAARPAGKVPLAPLPGHPAAPPLPGHPATPRRIGQRGAEQPRHSTHTPTITIPGNGTTQVIAEGIGGDGSLGVPADVHTVGWDVYSAAMDSAAGSTVLDGHVNYAGQGAGFFSDLASVHPGEVITTTSPAGITSHWRTTSQRLYLKDHGLPASLFNPGGLRQLVLISCGGAFDWSTGHYLSNVVVVAVPA